MQGTWIWSLVGKLRSHMQVSLSAATNEAEHHNKSLLHNKRSHMPQLRPSAAKQIHRKEMLQGAQDPATMSHPLRIY